MEEEGKVIAECKGMGKGIRIFLQPAEDGSIWMTISEIADLFCVGGASVERQIKKIFAAQELWEDRVRKWKPIEYAPGKLGTLDYYNLDMIIMLAYRMTAPFCSMFREWICQQLMQKTHEQKVPIFLQMNAKQGVNN